MSCCGEKRSRYYHNPYSQIEGEEDGGDNHSVSLPGRSYFKYTGSPPLTIKGMVTGNIYLFHNAGDTLEIDHRDVSFITGTPNLMRLKVEGVL